MRNRSQVHPAAGFLLLGLITALLFFSPALLGQDRLEGPCGTMPEGKPRRIKGGEAFPPLPLPATPLRRTERKRNPAPPMLIGKVMWGSERTYRAQDGRSLSYFDWNNDPSDVKRLLDIARGQLGIRYRSATVDLADFSFDPDEIPILWITGTKAVNFPAGTCEKLGAYLEAGGTVIGDACRGSGEFTNAFRQLAARILPGRALRPLGPDHPVFSCAVDLGGRAQYSSGTPDRTDGAPYLEGINIGCRTAVFYSPYALSCAWDSGHVTEGCPQMLEESALALGMNLLAYTIACQPLGRFLSRPPEAAVKSPKPGGFVLAQVRFGGEYNPDPSAFGRLLRGLSTRTGIQVALEHPFVAFGDPTLLDHPFIYMTGHGPFALTRGEAEGLRAYLNAGGFLFADACCGDLQFDQSFRRILATLLPESRLEVIPLDDPIYQSPERITTVEYTPRVKAAWPGLDRPHLEGIAVHGAWRVVYSRIDLGCGWEGEIHPYRMGVEGEDAVRLAVNVIVYAMTH
jgi:hypothetical protein